MRELLLALSDLTHDLKIVFPVHPRTRQRFADIGVNALTDSGLCLVEPKPYLEFLSLQRHAALVITDSGGIQEETAFLGIPWLTVRENTERPVTITLGTNVLVGRDIARLRTEVRRILKGEAKIPSRIPLWDGHAAERITPVILGLDNHIEGQPGLSPVIAA